MTVSNNKLVVPSWLVSVILSALASLFVAWGTVATLKEKARANELNIKTLQQDKVGNKEFTLVYDKLNSIERKLDEHISK